MKLTELMIGDWVHVPFLVDTVEHFDGNCKVKQLRCEDLDVYGFKEIKYDEIKPIPITPGILFNNGFICYSSGGCDEWSYWEGSRQVLFMYDRDGCFELNQFMEIKYVHELQQALRLCGVQKEIVL